MTALLASLLFVVFLWPLPLHWGSWLVGGNLIPTDGWMFVWNLWWIRKALVELHVSPLFAPDLFYPQGVTLGLHSLSLANGLLSIPLQTVGGPVAAHNWLMFLSFPLTAVGVYGFARELGSPRPGAMFAGVVFSCCPYRIAHTVGHLNLASTQWIPLSLWAILRLRRRPTVGHMVLSAAFVLMAALSSWYYGLLVAVSGVLMVALAPGEPTRRFWRWAAGSIALVVCGLWPVVGKTLVELASGHYRVSIAEGRQVAWAFSADLAAYAVPSVFHPLLKYPVASLYERFTGSWLENSVFPGYTLIALAGWWAARGEASKGTKLMLGVVGGAAFMLSLGPCLHLAGKTSFLREGGSQVWGYRGKGCLPLPYLLVALSPLSGLARVPARWAVLVVLALAVAAGLAIGSRRRLALAAGAVAAFEFLPIGMPMGGLQMSDVYHRIGSDGAVLELPVDLQMCSYTYLQTVHGRPLTYSHVSRIPTDALDVLGDLPTAFLTPATDDALRRAGVRRAPVWPGFLDKAVVGWVVLHVDRLSPASADRARHLLSSPPLQLVRKEGHTLLYKVHR